MQEALTSGQISEAFAIAGYYSEKNPHRILDEKKMKKFKTNI